MNKDIKDLVGQKFGRLTVLSLDHETKKGRRFWLCKCECGNEVVKDAKDILSGHVKSCGCLQRNVLGASKRTHGKSRTKIGDVLEGMKARCYNKNEISYTRYGARGIFICDEWLEDPIKFFEWAEKTNYVYGFQIDRIDNDGPYSPENCRWVTSKENNRNKRTNNLITHNGETECVTAWSEKLGIPPPTIFGRLARGHSIEEALSTNKLERGRRNKLSAVLVTINNETLSVAAWSKKLGIIMSTYYKRIAKGFTPEEALLTPVRIKKQSKHFKNLSAL
jgi:hypothetical protein